MKKTEQFEERMARLAAATKDLEPSPEFAARAARRIEDQQQQLIGWRSLWALGRKALLVAAIGAAVAVFLAYWADRQLEEEFISAAIAEGSI
jgi:anti-sigma-K factor RskA